VGKGGKREDPGGARTPHPQEPPPNASRAGEARQQPQRQGTTAKSNEVTPKVGLGPGGAHEGEVAVDEVRESRPR
jgi:hypothetical protein